MEPNVKSKTTIRIPLTLATMLLLQASMVLIWATQLDARVGGIEQQAISSRNLNEKFARLEERLDDVRQSMADIKRQMEQLTQNVMKQ